VNSTSVSLTDRTSLVEENPASSGPGAKALLGALSFASA
jgi:hypothetical protein